MPEKEKLSRKLKKKHSDVEAERCRKWEIFKTGRWIGYLNEKKIEHVISNPFFVKDIDVAG